MKKGFVSLIIASILFGAIGVFNRWIALPPIILSFYRSIIAAAFIFTVIKFKKDKISFSLKDTPWLILLSVGYIISSIAFIISTRYLVLSSAVFVFYLFPVLVALAAPVFLKEKIKTNTIVALFIALIGIYFLSGVRNLDELFQGKNLVGLACSLLAAFVYAMNILISKKLTASYSSYALTFAQSAIGAVILLPFVIRTDYVLNVHNIVLLLIFSIVVWGIGITLLFNGMKTVTATESTIIMYIDPLSATIYGLLLFQEIPTSFSLLGGILIITAGYLTVRNKPS